MIRRWRWIEDVVVLEANGIEGVVVDAPVVLVDGLEVVVAPGGVETSQTPVAVEAAAGGVDEVGVDIGTQNLDGDRLLVGDHGGGVGLFTGGDAGTPDVDRLRRQPRDMEVVQQRSQCRQLGLIAPEGGQTVGDEIDELLGFVGGLRQVFESVEVVGGTVVAVDGGPVLEGLGDATGGGLAEFESGPGLEEFAGPGDDFAAGDRCHLSPPRPAGSSWSTSRNKAGAISVSARVSSTTPWAIAARGMP